ncbi:MAG: beta-lactamase family protein, partial [Lachnospiraceae bacterium]|nr:beta-lactamase family protein [Lachnospiraceae bacterium]
MSNTFHNIDIKGAMGIKGRKGYGVSVAIAGKDGIETYCAGSGRFGQDFPVNPDMLFQAGSVSKPAFAATVLRYVDKGIIDLDADISGVVPEYAKSPMTFSALLSHTAGFNLHGFPGYRADHELFSLEDVLDGKGITPRLRRIRPYGKQYMYSGGGTTLAELAFTRITGTTLREAFQKEVAEPLGLARSGYFQPLDEDKVENAAFGGRLGLKEDPAHGYHYYPEHAAAGLWTTPTDLTKLGIALSRSWRGGGFLKQDTARRMLTPVLENYGLCVMNFRGDFGYHGGWNEGFLTEWFFSLRDDLCVASMHNRATERYDWQQTKTAIALFQDMEEAMMGDVDKSGWEAYCGKYEQLIEDFRVEEVFMQDGDLYI